MKKCGLLNSGSTENLQTSVSVYLGDWIFTNFGILCCMFLFINKVF